MGFIKFKEEKIWKEWKEKEEAILREYKVDEVLIGLLYEYDWNDFKRNRSFKEHQSVSNQLIDIIGKNSDTYEVTNIEVLLDQLSDVNLFNLLNQLDSLTLAIIFMKYQGYSSNEISRKLNITVRSIDCKLFRLRKKYKKARYYDFSNGM